MNEYLNLYNWFDIIFPICIIIIGVSISSIIVSLIHLFDCTNEKAKKFKTILMISVFTFFISSTVFGIFSYKMKKVFASQIVNDCEKIKRVAAVTNDEKLKVQYFDICVKDKIFNKNAKKGVVK